MNAQIPRAGQHGPSSPASRQPCGWACGPALTPAPGEPLNGPAGSGQTKSGLHGSRGLPETSRPSLAAPDERANLTRTP
jgi:hypothetical protein